MLKGYFVSNPNSDYFKSAQFNSVLVYVQTNPRLCKMKEDKNKLSLTFNNVSNVEQANHLLEQVQQVESAKNTA